MATVGVKVELEGAKAFSDGMKNLQSQTRLFDTEIKNIQKSMSKSAFQKSIQEGEALKKKLNALTSESDLLSQRIKEMSAAYGENDTRVIQLKQKYATLQGQIEKTNQALNENGGVFGAISKQLEDVGSKVSSVGDKLSKTVTASVVGVAGASMAAWNEVDAALDTVVTKTGATGDALKDLQTSVKNIATSIPTDFATAGDAIGEVNTRFGLTGTALEDLSTKFIEFAQINGTDVSSSIDTVQSAMAAFGLEADQAGIFLDTLNKAGQDTGISVDSLANTMTTNAAALKEMGYSASDSAFFIANLSKNGIDASAVMTGLKKALATASKDGKSMDDAMAELQATMENSSSSTEAYQTAIELFGTRAGASIAEACQSGRLSFDDLGTSMEDFAGNVDETFNNTLDPIDEFQVHMNELKLLGAEIGEQMMPIIMKAMEALGEVIKNLASAWNGLSESQQDMILKIAGIAAVVGPVISIIGRIVSAVSAIMPIISAVGALLTGTLLPAIGGLIAAIAPFLPIIAAVAAAVAAIVLVFQNWGAITDWMSEKVAQFQAFVIENFGILGEGIAVYIEIIKTVISTAFSIIQTIVQTVMSVIKAIWQGDWEQVGTILSEAWIKIQNSINLAKAKVIKLIVNLLTNIKNKFVEIKDAALGWGRDMISNFANGIQEKMHALLDKVKSMAAEIKSYIHFSQPDKGPLKDFNTYAPDMMKQYAEGIEANKYLVKQAVSDVAMDVNTVFSDSLSSEEIYAAIRQGASDSTTRIVLNNREVTRALGGMGVVFNG